MTLRPVKNTQVQPAPIAETKGFTIRVNIQAITIRTRLAEAVAEAPEPGVASTM